MRCDDARWLIAAYHDAELDAVRAIEVEQHLRGCASCNAALDNLRVLSDLAKSAAFPAPADLGAKVVASVRHADPEAAKIHKFRPASSWLAQGLALAAAVLLGFFVARALYQPSAQQPVLAELLDSHVRSLVGTHLTDVANSDQHTVRPWFEGKLDFAPPVEDLSAHGFPLVGGRVDYIAGRAAAVLVYQRRQHFINLFVWPHHGDAEISREKPQRGYNAVHWSGNGMTFWALSEISANELLQFAREFRGTTTNR